MTFVTKEYDPAGIKMIFSGNSITGYAAGTFVVAARTEDTFQTVAGADGEAARAKSNNRTGTIVFTLMQGSAANDVLAALALADEVTGDGVGSLLITDLNGTTLVGAGTAWVQKPADVEFGQELSDREWTIATGNLVIFPGGANVLAASATP